LENFFHKNDFAITHADGFGKRGASIPRIAVGRSVIIPDKVLFIEGLRNYTLKGVLLSNFSIFVPKKV
jgi:hypothetical protein